MQTDPPRCPAHGLEMASATRWLSLNGKRFPEPVHVCTVTGCPHIHDTQGFSQAPESELIGQPVSDAVRRLRFLGR